MAIEHIITVSDLADADASLAITDNNLVPSVPEPSGGGWSLTHSFASQRKLYYIWCRGTDTIVIVTNLIMSGNEGPVLADATSGTITVTLPVIAGNPNSMTIKKIDSSANVVTIITPGAETIDGQASIDLTLQYESVKLTHDGSNWFIV